MILSIADYPNGALSILLCLPDMHTPAACMHVVNAIDVGLIWNVGYHLRYRKQASGRYPTAIALSFILCEN